MSEVKQQNFEKFEYALGIIYHNSEKHLVFKIGAEDNNGKILYQSIFEKKGAYVLDVDQAHEPIEALKLLLGTEVIGKLLKKTRQTKGVFGAYFLRLEN